MSHCNYRLFLNENISLMIVKLQYCLTRVKMILIIFHSILIVHHISIKLEHKLCNYIFDE